MIEIKAVTPEMIAEWKKQLKVIKKIKVKTTSGSVVEFIIGRPTRDVLDIWVSKLDKEDNTGAREVLKTNCILAGDASIFAEDVNVESTVMKRITGMLQECEVEEEEL